MIDHVRQALGRILGVKQHHIGRWSLDTSSDSLSYFGGFAPSSLQADMSVQVHLAAYKKLHELAATGKCAVQITRLDGHRHESLEGHIDVKLTLLYGKETQHFFKALAQAFTVRGRPPKKKSTKSKGAK